MSKILYIEDEAPCHTGDACKLTGESDLKASRNEAFSQAGLTREIIPENGTPELLPNDQIHKVVKQLKTQFVHEVLGCGNDLTRRPFQLQNRSLAMKRGRPPFTLRVAMLGGRPCTMSLLLGPGHGPPSRRAR